MGISAWIRGFAVRAVGAGRKVHRTGLSSFAFLTLLVAPGCSRDASAPPIAPETFVDVMVQLRRAHELDITADQFAARRDAILRDAGVTDSMLVQWIRAQGSDVAQLSALWDTINARLTASEDSAR